MSFTKQEWNNGTIYRIFVRQPVTAASKPVLTVPIDIPGGELFGKVFIGVENLVLDRELAPGGLTDFANQDEDKLSYWAQVRYLLMRCTQLPPDIDYNSRDGESRGKSEQIMARIPLPIEYLVVQPESDTQELKVAMNPRVSVDRSLSKSDILYEMTNNANALHGGTLRIELLDEDGDPLYEIDEENDTRHYRVDNLSFTLVIYKPRNTYN